MSEWRTQVARIAQEAGIDAQSLLDRVDERARSPQAPAAHGVCTVCGHESICDETRFVSASPGTEVMIQCPHFCEYETAQRLARAQKQAGLSERHRSCTLETYFAPNADCEAAAQAVRRYVDSWPEHRGRGEGMYLCGPTGTGKTHLAYATVNALIEQHRVPALVVRAQALLAARRRGYGDPTRAESAEQQWEAAMTVTLLLLDDLGAAKPSEWVQEQLYALLDQRYIDNLPTIVTSNEHPDHLAERIGARSASRVYEMCAIVQVPAEDIRRGMSEIRSRSG